jgi:membrane associated rhomboid family serine protease
MGIHDREYYQEEDNAGGSIFGNIASWPWSYRLMGLYAVIFFIFHVVRSQTGPADINSIEYWTHYSTSLTFAKFQLWRIVTYMFVEPTPGGFLGTLLGLYFLGTLAESLLGRGPFLVFYILCGIGSALVASVLVPVFGGREAMLLGELGPILGMIVVAGVLAPNQTIMFMFVLQMTMRTLMIVSVVIAAAFTVAGSPTSAASLGGAATAYLLVTNPQVLTLFGQLSPRRSTRRTPGKMTVKFPDVSSLFTPKPVSEDEVDRLLDKVHAQGLDSLTAREKALLKRAAKQKRNRPL